MLDHIGGLTITGYLGIGLLVQQMAVADMDDNNTALGPALSQTGASPGGNYYGRYTLGNDSGPTFVIVMILLISKVDLVRSSEPKRQNKLYVRL